MSTQHCQNKWQAAINEEIEPALQSPPLKVRILGCSGGVGSGRKTIAILIDDDMLIDAGTGVADLTIEELGRIGTVLLTHAHLDHTVGLPLFLDTAFESRMGVPVDVFANSETLDAIKKHIFNDVIWPDFTVLPDPDSPIMRCHEVSDGDLLELGRRKITAVAVKHSVPTLGYCVEVDGRVIAFSGDTTRNESLWRVLNEYDRLDALLVEVSFPNRQAQLAKDSRHYCSGSFIDDVRNLRHKPDIWITSMKPGEEKTIMGELRNGLPDMQIQAVEAGQIIEI